MVQGEDLCKTFPHTIKGETFFFALRWKKKHKIRKLREEIRNGMKSWTLHPLYSVGEIAEVSSDPSVISISYSTVFCRAHK